MTAAQREQILARYRERAATLERLAGSRPPAAPAPAPAAAGRGEALSERQLEILQLIAHGHGNGEIAGKLVLSVETVKSHVRQMLAKMNAANRAHAVALGLRVGYIS
jgi:DNA-binding NarL/FixJ family response regulator